jgi:hypothetical protein
LLSECHAHIINHKKKNIDSKLSTLPIERV